MCCCNHKSVDLSLIADVLDKYAAVKGSLITILQKTQDIYGYIPSAVTVLEEPELIQRYLFP